MALYLMQKAGVADKVDIRPLGDLATMLGALKTGSVSASMATMSMMEQARQEAGACRSSTPPPRPRGTSSWAATCPASPR